MANEFVVVDYMYGDETSVGLRGSGSTFEEALEYANFTVSRHLFGGIFKESLGYLEYEAVGNANEIRGLHITDGYCSATVVILSDNFCYCYV